MYKTTSFFKRNKLLFCFLIAIGFSCLLTAQKPRTITGLEINLPQKTVNYHFEGNKRINDDTGLPIAIYNIKHKVNVGTPESMAKQYLQDAKNTLGLSQNDINNLKLHSSNTSLSGITVRLRQFLSNLPINKSEITVSINNSNEVTYVMNGLDYNINIKNFTPSLTIENAKQIAYNHLNINGIKSFEKQELFIYSSDVTKLAYRINVMAHGLIGEWEVFVDAKSGEIFKAEDISYYCFNGDENETPELRSISSTLATGTGNVFNPDPLSSATVAYGTGGYTDNNDANSADLTSQTMSVTLLDIDNTGANYQLKGPYAEVVDSEAPFNGLYVQASSDFSYQRFDDAFEAVSVYYHIDASMRYINTTLGITLMPYQYAGGVRVDPHGLSGSDNSYYLPGIGELAFGEGCVDDAEDSDVVHHELGHGIHDWLTSGGASSAEGLGEGSGDYWAQSYNRSLGYWSSTDAAYNYMFNWDGHNECWGGRTTDYGASYPGGLVGQIHTDGQIWATCLMKIYDIIGKAQTDKIFLEGLGMTNGSSSQNDAAVAAYNAAISMGYPTSEIITIYNEFTSCGYTLPEQPTTPIADFEADNTTLCIDSGPVVINFSDLTSGVPESWSWSFVGGTPATSSDQNPSITYNTEGAYQVELTATNSFGSDTETKVAYINIVSGAACPSCVTTTSTDVPLTISASGTPTVTSNITISGSGIINDVNLLDLMITHTWDSDLDVTLTSPAGTVVDLFNDLCFLDDNFDLSLDDQASTSVIDTPCPPTDGLVYQPTGMLSDFNGEDANGTWTLTVFDDTSADGGSLDAWSLEICFDPPLSIEDNTIGKFSIYPNPNDGSFNVKLNGQTSENISISVFDIRGRSIFNNIYSNSSNFNERVDLNGVHSGIYMMKIQSGNQTITKKIIVK